MLRYRKLSVAQWPGTLFAICCLVPIQSAAVRSEVHQFNVKSTDLALALIEVGRQSGVSVATLEGNLPLIRTPALDGAMNVDQALRILLRDTGYRYRKVKGGGYVVERAASARRAKLAKANRSPSEATIEHADVVGHDYVDTDPIIITAAKNDMPLSDYAGSAYIATVNDDQIRTISGRGSDALVDMLPVLSTSSLGQGRNKIYGRAISDGSFNGFMQNNMGLYLGDLRMTFSSPDPNLQLVDLERVEILLGPHGTLYGSGALGGVMRLQPNMPHLTDNKGEISIEGHKITHGAVGGAVIAMANTPILPEKLAFRAVGYQMLEGGYIDHVPVAGQSANAVEMKDSNRTQIRGARAALRWQMDETSVLDLNLTYQDIDGRDISHTSAFTHSPTTTTPILQPFGNDILSRSLSLQKDMDGWKLTSVSGWIDQRTHETFHQGITRGGLDALRTDRKIAVLSHETRISADLGVWNIIFGMSALKNKNSTFDVTKLFWNLDRETQITSYEYAAFGEVRRVLGSGFTLMLGGRAAHLNENIDIRLLGSTSEPESHHVKRWNFLPSGSVSWKSRDGHLLFAAYHEGYFPYDFFGMLDPDQRKPAPDRVKM